MVTPVAHGPLGPFIVTYPTRTKFYFRKPHPDMVHLDDIAWSLSLQPRFLGHICRHYSVLEHSMRVATEVYNRTNSKQAFCCAMLHDAEEAYTGDMPTPIKRDVPDFVRIGDRIKATILMKFGLTEAYTRWEPFIKEYDDRMLHTESIRLGHGATWEDQTRVLEDQDIPLAPEFSVRVLLGRALVESKGDFSFLAEQVRLSIQLLECGGEQARQVRIFKDDLRRWL